MGHKYSLIMLTFAFGIWRRILQLISASHFYLFASYNPQYWKSIEGCEIVHRVWGKCTVGKVDLAQKIVFIQDRKVALEFFRDDVIKEFWLPTEIVEKITQFAKQKEEETKLAERIRIDLERSRILEEHYGKQDILNKMRAEMWKESEEKRQRELARLKFEREREQEEAIRIAQLVKELSQKRVNLISNFCSYKMITGLVHFTRTKNLTNIIKHGLLCREVLSEWSVSERPIFNDSLRLDGHLDAICLSISFPNYRMFYKLNNNAQDEWVVLVLKPSLLWELDCAFYEKNAASASVSKIPLANRKLYDSLEKMFVDTEQFSRDELGLPSYYTTNPQAEVLVFDPIPVTYIREVHFYSNSEMNSWNVFNNQYGALPFVVSNEYFKPRFDYAKWQGAQEYLPEPPEFDDYIPEYY